MWGLESSWRAACCDGCLCERGLAVCVRGPSCLYVREAWLSVCGGPSCLCDRGLAVCMWGLESSWRAACCDGCLCERGLAVYVRQRGLVAFLLLDGPLAVVFVDHLQCALLVTQHVEHRRLRLHQLVGHQLAALDVTLQDAHRIDVNVQRHHIALLAIITRAAPIPSFLWYLTIPELCSILDIWYLRPRHEWSSIASHLHGLRRNIDFALQSLRRKIIQPTKVQLVTDAVPDSQIDRVRFHFSTSLSLKSRSSILTRKIVRFETTR